MVSLFIFCSFHLFITLKNYTTYEYITKVIRKNKNNENNDSTFDIRNIVDESQVSMFDIGLFLNFKQVFGKNFYLWCISIYNGKQTFNYIILTFNRRERKRCKF